MTKLNRREALGFGAGLTVTALGVLACGWPNQSPKAKSESLGDLMDKYAKVEPFAHPTNPNDKLYRATGKDGSQKLYVSADNGREVYEAAGGPTELSHIVAVSWATPDIDDPRYNGQTYAFAYQNLQDQKGPVTLQINAMDQSSGAQGRIHTLKGDSMDTTRGASISWSTQVDPATSKVSSITVVCDTPTGDSMTSVLFAQN